MIFGFCEKWGENRGEGKHSKLRRPFPFPTPLPSGHAVVRRCGGRKCTDGVRDSGVLGVRGCADFCWGEGAELL